MDWGCRKPHVRHFLGVLLAYFNFLILVERILVSFHIRVVFVIVVLLELEVICLIYLSRIPISLL